MLYLDTSALLKLYVLEEGSRQVQDLISAQEDPLPIWEIQEFEFQNALHLKAFRKQITPEQCAGQIDLFKKRKLRGQYFFPEIQRSDLSDRFSDLSRHTLTLGCRTMDVLHVACASCLGIRDFVTFDERQAGLARLAGMNLPIPLPMDDRSGAN